MYITVDFVVLLCLPRAFTMLRKGEKPRPFKALFHSSRKLTRKLAARTFIQYPKALGASLRVGFCDEWKRGFRLYIMLYFCER